MAERQIKLAQGVWYFDPNVPLGKPGSFGAVYSGRDNEARPVAIKKLHLAASAAAHRELRIAEELQSRVLQHAIPILDSGQDADSDEYFVVMARAEESLEDYCMRTTIPEAEAVGILKELVAGLNEIGDLVHRDLKPANVLKHEGRWKIADFGIARFVEEATSSQTLRTFLSPPYAAPEQWNLEATTKSTDVYALGCIGYRLLSGKLPFPGPTLEDYRHQHLTAPAPPLNGVSPTIASLVSHMMRKIPITRPKLARIIEILRSPAPAQRAIQSISALSAADALIANEEAEAQARLLEQKRILEARSALSKHASELLQDIAGRLVEAITQHATTARHESLRVGVDMLHKIACGPAVLQISCPRGGDAYQPGLFQQSRWDVICGGLIKVTMQRPRLFERSASFWYTNLGFSDEYRWYEASYWLLGDGPSNHMPFGLGFNQVSVADEAAGPGMHSYMFATKPRRIDEDFFDDFAERWIGIFATAMRGALQYPSRLPLD